MKNGVLFLLFFLNLVNGEGVDMKEKGKYANI